MRTKCSHGHKYTPETTYRRIDGKRGCRTCRDGVVQLPREEVAEALRKGVEDFRALLRGLHRDLSNNEEIALRYVIDDLDEVIYDLFYVPTYSADVRPNEGDEVSIKYSDNYYEESVISHIDGDRVYLEDDCNPFDLKTGKPMNGHTNPYYRDAVVLFDNGYAFQHWEDLSLGEGDTL